MALQLIHAWHLTYQHTFSDHLVIACHRRVDRGGLGWVGMGWAGMGWGGLGWGRVQCYGRAKLPSCRSNNGTFYFLSLKL